MKRAVAGVAALLVMLVAAPASAGSYGYDGKYSGYVESDVDADRNETASNNTVVVAPDDTGSGNQVGSGNTTTSNNTVTAPATVEDTKVANDSVNNNEVVKTTGNNNAVQVIDDVTTTTGPILNPVTTVVAPIVVPIANNNTVVAPILSDNDNNAVIVPILSSNTTNILNDVIDVGDVNIDVTCSVLANCEDNDTIIDNDTCNVNSCNQDNDTVNIDDRSINDSFNNNRDSFNDNDRFVIRGSEAVDPVVRRFTNVGSFIRAVESRPVLRSSRTYRSEGKSLPLTGLDVMRTAALGFALIGAGLLLDRMSKSKALAAV